MIPDKIYIGTVTLSSNAPSEEYLLPDWHLRPNPKVANVEYIRKDALMEWATNLKERWKEPPVSVHSPGCVYMLEQIIDKLNEL